VVAVIIVDADLYFQLRLAQKPGRLGEKPNAGIEVGQLQFAILAKQIDSRR